MSGIVTGLIFGVHFGDRTAKKVALALGDHASHDGTGAYPGRRLLSRKTELSRSSVIDALNRLERCGLIWTEDRSGGRGRGFATEWNFNMEMLYRLEAAHRAHWRAVDKGDAVGKPVPLIDKGSSTRTLCEGSSSRPEGSSSRTEGSSSPDPNRPEPSTEPLADGAPSAPAWFDPEGYRPQILSELRDDGWNPDPASRHRWRKRNPEATLDGQSVWLRRDLLHEAVATWVGSAPVDGATKSERGRWNQAVHELRGAGADPMAVMIRGAEYTRRWASIDRTAQGLAKNWSALAEPQKGNAAPARVPDQPERPDPDDCPHPPPWSTTKEFYICTRCLLEWPAGQRPPHRQEGPK